MKFFDSGLLMVVSYLCQPGSGVRSRCGRGESSALLPLAARPRLVCFATRKIEAKHDIGGAEEWAPRMRVARPLPRSGGRTVHDLTRC